MAIRHTTQSDIADGKPTCPRVDGDRAVEASGGSLIALFGNIRRSMLTRTFSEKPWSAR